MTFINKKVCIALLLTAMTALSARDYTEAFRTIGKKRGQQYKQLLQKKGTFTYPAELGNWEKDLSILYLLTLNDCPKELAHQHFSLWQAFFKGMKRTFKLRNKHTGKDAHLRRFIIHLYTSMLSSAVSATDMDAFYEELDKRQPELIRFANKSLSPKEQNLITAMHNGSTTPFDLATLIDTPDFKRGLEIGQRINNTLLNNLKNEADSTSNSSALIKEVFDVLVQQTSIDTSVVNYCAGIYLSRASLGTIHYSSSEKNTAHMDSYKMFRYAISDILDDNLSSYTFEYEGYYREVVITKDGSSINIQTQEGFHDPKPLEKTSY